MSAVAATAPLAFLAGVLVGWWISSRYRITKVNGKS
jgi:uncharacterized protein YneF (UPF0154 family)